MTALVLGATGFIGSHIVRACLARGIAVRAMRRASSSTRAIADLPVELVVGDLIDQDTLVAAMRGCDVVFHAAGYYPPTSRNTQAALRLAVTHMQNVLEAAARTDVSRVVYTSSIGTIGPSGEASRLANEGDLYVPRPGDHPYLRIKWAQEQEAYRSIARGVPVVILNPTVCVGPGNANLTSGMVLLVVASS